MKYLIIILTVLISRLILIITFSIILTILLTDLSTYVLQARGRLSVIQKAVAKVSPETKN